MQIKLKCKTERKIVAKIIGETIGEAVIYERTPTYAYKIGDFHIDRDGYIKAEFDEIFLIVLEVIVEHIIPDFIFIINDVPQISNKIRNMIENKHKLIEKAISGKISTATFDEHIEIYCNLADFSKIIAIGVFINKLYNLAITLKYVSVKEKEVVNERYTFRCFLLRLGFVGTEYKIHRITLLKDLSGNSAFKNGGVKNEIS